MGDRRDIAGAHLPGLTGHRAGGVSVGANFRRGMCTLLPLFSPYHQYMPGLGADGTDAISRARPFPTIRTPLTSQEGGP